MRTNRRSQGGGAFLLLFLLFGSSARLRQENAEMLQKGGGSEWGFAVCRDRQGRLTRGPEAVGERMAVSVPVKCPSGCSPIALFHVHPDGYTDPSAADMSETRRFGLKHVCIGQPESGEIRCHRA